MTYSKTAVALVGSLALASAPAAAEYSGLGKPNVLMMSTKEIREHNAALARDHPYYITCKRQQVTGSLARKTRVCHTAEEWRQVSEDAQKWLGDTMDKARTAPCPPPACVGGG